MPKEKKLTVEYFALLAQEAGKGMEILQTTAETLESLFDELKKRYFFSLSSQQVIASINCQLASSWDITLSDGDHIMLLTPLTGG